MDSSDPLIVVPSCANYSDTWIPFTTLLRRFWPQCPWRHVLVTDCIADAQHIDFDETVIVGYDKGWCANLLHALSAKSTSSLILLWLDDLFLCDTPDSAQLDDIVRHLRTHTRQPAYFRLLPCPGANVFKQGERWGHIARGAAYRVSTMPSFWRTPVLIDLLSRVLMTSGKRASAWDFEIEGTRLLEETDWQVASVVSGNRPLPCHVSGIDRGLWNRNTVQFLREHGISVDLKRRPASV